MCVHRCRRRAVGPPKTFTAAELYPLEPGWKWAYDLVKDGQTMLALYSVLERTGDSATVQAGEEQLGYAITPEGIAQKDGRSSVISS